MGTIVEKMLGLIASHAPKIIKIISCAAHQVTRYDKVGAEVQGT